MAAEDLVEVLRGLGPIAHPWLAEAAAPMEDAALLRPETGPALVLTVDFITPIVDDPEHFGAIAAANALSDVYAMGAEPRVALAVCGFPAEALDREVLAAIFRGGREKAAEAGCAVAGGHTVLDPELKYGLCVLGALEHEPPFRQAAGRPGDRLVLTKPLGFGIAAQAMKAGALDPAEVERVSRLMAALNRDARDAAHEAGVRAATDVTGFGLLGHLHNLALASGTAARVCASAVPWLDCAQRLAEAGFLPGGSRKNLAYVASATRFDSALPEIAHLMLADAQTSGGLLLAVPPENEIALLRALERRGTPARATVGELCEGPAGALRVDP